MTASETVIECIEAVDIQQCVEGAEDEREVVVMVHVSQRALDVGHISKYGENHLSWVGELEPIEHLL